MVATMSDPKTAALEYAAEHLSSDWPERCQEIVRRARAALSERDPTEQELRAAAHEFTVRADRLAATSTRGEDVDA